jgi:predicted permease
MNNTIIDVANNTKTTFDLGYIILSSFLSIIGILAFAVFGFVASKFNWTVRNGAPLLGSLVVLLFLPCLLLVEVSRSIDVK